jgi:hypothetical protein
VRKSARPLRRTRTSRWQRWQTQLSAFLADERVRWVLIGAGVGLVLILLALVVRALLWPNAHF